MVERWSTSDGRLAGRVDIPPPSRQPVGHGGGIFWLARPVEGLGGFVVMSRKNRWWCRRSAIYTLHDRWDPRPHPAVDCAPSHPSTAARRALCDSTSPAGAASSSRRLLTCLPSLSCSVACYKKHKGGSSMPRSYALMKSWSSADTIQRRVWQLQQQPRPPRPPSSPRRPQQQASRQQHHRSTPPRRTHWLPPSTHHHRRSAPSPACAGRPSPTPRCSRTR